MLLNATFSVVVSATTLTFPVNSLNKYKFVRVAKIMMNRIKQEDSGLSIETIVCENLGHFSWRTNPNNRGGSSENANVATLEYGMTMEAVENINWPKVNVQMGIVTENSHETR
jgi:hypothetical protein